MNRKIIIIVLILFAINSFVACKYRDDPNSYESSDVPPESQQTTVSTLIERGQNVEETPHNMDDNDNIDEPDENHNDIDYTEKRIISGVYTVKYDLVDIVIEFPQIDGFPDQYIEDTVNELIYNFVITHDEMEWEKFRYNKHITFEVTYFSDKYISIVFSGEINRLNHNAYKEAISIDLETGEKLVLSDFYSEDEMLDIINTLMLTEKCTIVGELWNDSPWLEANELVFQQCISQFGEKNDSSWERGFYLREDKLGLIIYLTLSDYPSAEFELLAAPWMCR